MGIGKMKVIREEVGYWRMREKDWGGRWWVREGLEKEDVLMNWMLGEMGWEVVWGMVREGRRL